MSFESCESAAESASDSLRRRGRRRSASIWLLQPYEDAAFLAVKAEVDENWGFVVGQVVEAGFGNCAARVGSFDLQIDSAS